MILTERALEEVRQKVITVLGLSSSVIVTKATKFIRFDWRELLDFFEKNAGAAGENGPYCIIRPGPIEEDDWGMAVAAYLIPIEIFFVEKLRNRVSTVVSVGATSAVQTVDSTTNMFVDQRLYFGTAGTQRIVQSVDSPTQVTLTQSVTTLTNDTVKSDITNDVEVKVEKLRVAFYPGGTFTNFQIVDAPETDCSDMNPANEYELENNYYLFAGSCFIKVLVGETL